MTTQLRKIFLPSLLCVLWVALPTFSHAGDGVIEINQAKALAGGVTPGDAEGFPVTIGASGSYRLTGDLTVPDENTTAIDISFGSGARQVTLDLNGFSIVGPTTCASTIPTTDCGPVGTGRGVQSVAVEVEVRNGFVRGMGAEGIYLSDSATVENLKVSSSGGDGFFVLGTVRNCKAVRNGGNGFNGSGSLFSSEATLNVENGIQWSNGQIVDSTAQLNGDNGIAILTGIVRGNFAERNVEAGIAVTSSTSSTLIEGNNASGNGSFGLLLNGVAGYKSNVMNSNTAGGVDLGVQIGTNLCGNVVCP